MSTLINNRALKEARPINILEEEMLMYQAQRKKILKAKLKCIKEITERKFDIIKLLNS